MALNEWGLQASVINEQWSPELLWLMFRERSREIARVRHAQRGEAGDPEQTEPRRVLTDLQIFKRIPGIKYVPPKANS